MSCRHCMRGDSENISMNYEVIDRLFKETRYIHHLCITGGEPSLAVDVIKEILYRARYWGCKIDSFFCATNAKECLHEFSDVLTELYFYCAKRENCGLTVSKDQFHSKASKEAIQLYSRLPYYSSVYEHGEISPYCILNEGRAKESEIGCFEIPRQKYIYNYSMLGLNFKFNDMIYINAKGDVLLDADLSYESQSKLSIGNLLEEKLEVILISSLYKNELPKDRNVFRVRLNADARTITEFKFKNDSYYSNENIAMGSFSHIIQNLPYTPKMPKQMVPPDNLRLEVQIVPEDELFKYQLAKAEIIYRENGTEIGSVNVVVEYFPLEDMNNE